MTLNYVVSFLSGRSVRKNLKSAINADRTIGHLIQAFRCVTAESLISLELVELKKLLGQAIGKMEKVEGLVSLSKFPGGFVLDVLFLWNLNLARAFDRWWAENGATNRGLSSIESINMKTGKTPARKAVREKELITAYPKLFVTDINRAANYYEQKLRPPVFHWAFASLRDGFLDLVRPTNIPDSSVSPRSILSSLFVSIRVSSRFKRKHGGIGRDAAGDRAAVRTSDENSGLNDFDPRNRAQSQP